MGYTKKWVPPVIPTSNSLTAWKTLCQDIHENLILAGLVQADDTGQLDIDSVVSQPANGSYAGYIVYRFDDELQDTSPIFIRLRFGSGLEGVGSGNSSRRGGYLWVEVVISTETDGAGTPAGRVIQSYVCPQSANPTQSGTSLTENTNNGMSYACRNDDLGFFGFVYGAASRNVPSKGNPFYIGASLVILIQRSLGANGQPDATGFSVLFPHLHTTNPAVQDMPAMCIYTSDESTSAASRRMALRVGGAINSVHGDDIELQPVFFENPRITQWPTLATYAVNSIIEGVEFSLEVIPGRPMNYIALGNGLSMNVDEISGWDAAFAMLFE